MCFSPEASFTAAAILAAAGAASLAQRPSRRHLPFALFPLIFAFHQSIEGSIWLSLRAGGAPPVGLVLAYLFVAQIFWPTYAPFAALMMARERRRRIMLIMLLALGLAVSGALAAILLQHAYTIKIVHHSLRYSASHDLGTYMIGLYMLATIAPFLIVRHRYVVAFGGAVFLGAAVTAIAYSHAAASVWCFFAAAASLFVFLHVRRESRSKALNAAQHN